MHSMKEIFLLLLLVSGCALLPQKEEKFVNPLFYKKMENLSSHYFWDIQLTPTSLTSYLRNTDTKTFQKCYLLENTQSVIILSCEGAYNTKRREKIKCILDNTPFKGHVRCYTSDDKYDDPQKNWDSVFGYDLYL